MELANPDTFEVTLVTTSSSHTHAPRGSRPGSPNMPIWVMYAFEGGTDVSSSSSREAAASRDSFSSTKPPGMAHLFWVVSVTGCQACQLRATWKATE
eukprot:1146736-Pelagomonas_calceolata.AAC.3